MSKENVGTDNFSENILNIIKKSSLFDRILKYTNNINKKINSIGTFCLFISFFTIVSYNRIRQKLKKIDKQITNANIFTNTQISTINDIAEKMTIITRDIFDMKLQLKNLCGLSQLQKDTVKTLATRSTSTTSLLFLLLEEESREKEGEKVIQCEEKSELKHDNDYNDIIKEHYDIIPCNNSTKYNNSKFSLFF